MRLLTLLVFVSTALSGKRQREENPHSYTSTKTIQLSDSKPLPSSDDRCTAEWKIYEEASPRYLFAASFSSWPLSTPSMEEVARCIRHLGADWGRLRPTIKELIVPIYQFEPSTRWTKQARKQILEGFQRIAQQGGIQSVSIYEPLGYALNEQDVANFLLDLHLILGVTRLSIYNDVTKLETALHLVRDLVSFKSVRLVALKDFTTPQLLQAIGYLPSLESFEPVFTEYRYLSDEAAWSPVKHVIRIWIPSYISEYAVSNMKAVKNITVSPSGDRFDLAFVSSEQQLECIHIKENVDRPMDVSGVFAVLSHHSRTLRSVKFTLTSMSRGKSEFFERMTRFLLDSTMIQDLELDLIEMQQREPPTSPFSLPFLQFGKDKIKSLKLYVYGNDEMVSQIANFIASASQLERLEINFAPYSAWPLIAFTHSMLKIFKALFQTIDRPLTYISIYTEVPVPPNTSKSDKSLGLTKICEWYWKHWKFAKELLKRDLNVNGRWLSSIPASDGMNMCQTTSLINDSPYISIGIPKSLIPLTGRSL